MQSAMQLFVQYFFLLFPSLLLLFQPGKLLGKQCQLQFLRGIYPVLSSFLRCKLVPARSTGKCYWDNLQLPQSKDEQPDSFNLLISHSSFPLDYNVSLLQWPGLDDTCAIEVLWTSTLEVRRDRKVWKKLNENPSVPKPPFLHSWMALEFSRTF